MTPGFTIDNLCKALGVHRNYSFLPPYYTVHSMLVNKENHTIRKSVLVRGEENQTLR